MGFVFQDHEIVKKRWLWLPGLNWRRYPRGRLLVWLTYRVDAWLHGHNAEGWRRTSLTIHAVNSVLVLWLSLSMMPLSTALIAAGLFVAHPLTVMGSSYIAGRSSSLGTTFQLAALGCALDGQWLSAVLIAAIACAFVKEDSVMIVLVLGAIYWIL